MTIATNNGVPIIKDGKIVTDCGCCGGWSCFSSRCLGGCLDCPRQLVFTLSAPEVTGQPWAEPGGLKRSSITFPAVSESVTVDISMFDTPQRPSLPQGQSLRLEYSGGCGILARATTQVAFTMQQNGQDAFTGYANEQRGARVFVDFSLAAGMTVRSIRSWQGMGYGYPSGSNFPAETVQEWYSPVSSPVTSCKQFPSGFSPVVTTVTSRGGFPGPTTAESSGFCLVPIWDGMTQSPAVGEQYGYMVGFVQGCSSPFYGNQIRVAGLDMTISVSVQ